MSSTVVLSTKQHTTTPIIKPNPAKQYLDNICTKLVGDLSFIVVVSFLFIPVCFTSFLFVYFGFVHGVLFVAAVCLYNYTESKYHPLGETRRKWDAFTNIIGQLWEPFARMKEVNIVKLGKESSYSPHRKYMFGFHPHGILFLGPSTIVFNMERYFPGIKCHHLMSSSSFIAPIFRQFCMWIGGIPVTKEAAREATRAGSSLSLVPGGLAEMLLADPRPRKLEEAELKHAIICGETPLKLSASASDDTQREVDNSRERKTVVLYMQRRKGFIKLAIQLGLDLVPVFTFGELENYHQVRWALPLRMKLSRMLKLPLTCVYGKFGLVPFSEPMTVLVGEPIRMEQDEDPSDAVIEFYHKKYLSRLSSMFEENKVKYGHADSRLIFM